jgi:deazaflavin-dependent oxidoreductase (nitroreductase family)
MATNPYAQFNDAVIAEFHTTGGTVARFGRSLVLLHHTGAKTGTARVTPVMGIRDGNCWLIAASKAGADDNPAWYHNLVAHPDVELWDGTVKKAYRAREIHGAERQEWWDRAVKAWPSYDDYRSKTDRVIPVLVLEPAS